MRAQCGLPRVRRCVSLRPHAVSSMLHSTPAWHGAALCSRTRAPRGHRCTACASEQGSGALGVLGA
eukprot:14049973-Alexandrium_andersonii.AAC.1